MVTSNTSIADVATVNESKLASHYRMITYIGLMTANNKPTNETRVINGIAQYIMWPTGTVLSII